MLGLTARDTAFFANLNKGLSALNTDWLFRVTNAGGARPSDATFAANDVFYAALVSAGIDTKLKVCNLFVPDNILACSTPLIQGPGSATWISHGNSWISSHLTSAGLQNPGGLALSFDTGFTPGTFMTSSSGFGFVYVSVDDTSTISEEFGVDDNTGLNDFRMFNHYTDNHTYCYVYRQSQLLDSGVRGTGAGYMALSRTTSSRADVFFANSGNSHSSIVNVTGTETNTPSVTNTISVFAGNDNGTLARFSLKRLSAVGFGTGLNSTESSALHDAIVAFRTAVGGGVV